MIGQISSFSHNTALFTAGSNSIADAAPIGLLHYTHSEQSTPLSSASALHYSASTLYTQIFTAGSIWLCAVVLHMHSGVFGYILYALTVL